MARSPRPKSPSTMKKTTRSGASGSSKVIKGNEDQSNLKHSPVLMSSVLRDRTNLNLESSGRTTKKNDAEKEELPKQHDDEQLKASAKRSRIKSDQKLVKPIKEASENDDDSNISSAEQNDGSLDHQKAPKRRLRVKTDDKKSNNPTKSSEKADEQTESDDEDDSDQQKTSNRRLRVKSAKKVMENEDISSVKTKKQEVRSKSQQTLRSSSRRNRRSSSAPSSKESSPVRKSGRSKKLPEQSEEESSSEKPTKSNAKQSRRNQQNPSSPLMRQTTLKESFANVAQHNLRQRKMVKYDELSVTATEIDEDNDKVPKNDDVNGKKVPVYKKLQESHDDETNVDEIYEFKLDENEIKQAKRKKKRVVRRRPVKRVNKPKDIIFQKQLEQASKLAQSDHIANKHQLPAEVAPAPPKPRAEEKKLEPKKNIKQTAPQSKKLVSKNQNVNEDLIEAAPLNTDRTRVSRKRQFYNHSDVYADENSLSRVNGGQKITVVADIHSENIELDAESVPKDHDKPKVVSDQILHESSRINLSPKRANKMMIDHSLLHGPLSPIKTVDSSSEVDSPWRPCIAQKTFSRVKNVFQSTPQLEAKASILIRRPNYEKLNRTDANLKTKYLTPTEESPEKVSKISPSKSPRRFGTNISNINSSNSTSSIPSFQESPSKFGQLTKSFQSPIKSIPNSPQVFRVEVSHITPVKRPLGSMNEDSRKIPTLNLDKIVEDKENSAPNSESPKKSPVKLIRTPGSSPLRPLFKVTRRLVDKLDCKEVDNPQPGPSTLERVDSNPKSLKQTNLNTFLNIPDKPESTQINDSLLFCDVETVVPAINTKKKKATKKASDKFDVNHAFGFDNDDDDSSQLRNSVTIYRADADSRDVNDKNKVETTRIPVKNIARVLIPIIENKDSEKECDDVASAYADESLIDGISFDNTFDCENQNKITGHVKFIPLFEDPEPVHFKQPPRYSYKRKRYDTINPFGETDRELSDCDSDSDESTKRKTRKKKLKKIKVDRQQQKELNDWAKNVNKTFEEIDNFDLLVE